MQRKLIAPLLLLITGVYVLIGCIPIPGNFKKGGTQPRPESQIGALNSDKPIKLRGSTSGQVAELLGPPTMVSRDGGIAVYSYSINDVSIFWPLCFATDKQYSPRHLLLRFGPEGRLESFKTFKDLSKLNQEISWTPLEKLPPPGAPLRPQQKY